MAVSEEKPVARVVICCAMCCVPGMPVCRTCGRYARSRDVHMREMLRTSSVRLCATVRCVHHLKYRVFACASHVARFAHRSSRAHAQQQAAGHTRAFTQSPHCTKPSSCMRACLFYVILAQSPVSCLRCLFVCLDSIISRPIKACRRRKKMLHTKYKLKKQ